MKNPFKKQPEPTIKEYTQWAILYKYLWEKGLIK
jgi:hypothetical protein